MWRNNQIKSSDKLQLLASVILLCLLIAIGASAQGERRYPWQYFWQQSLAAYKDKNYALFLDHSRKAVEAGPLNHPSLYYNLARAYGVNGNKAEAVNWLEKTLILGFGSEALTSVDFPFLLDAADYADLRKRLETIKSSKVKSQSARTISEPDLIPESVAFDRKSGNFFVGALYKQKVVRIDPRGNTSDFVREGQDGLGSVVGIKIDQARNILWVLNNIAPEMKNFDKSREGIGMIHKYEFTTGKLIKKYELGNKPRPHLLNDLVIAANGDLFITDSLSSIVHVLRSGKDELENFVSLEPYSYPNGIAFSKDESKLYIANLNGIAIVEAKTGKVVPLATVETVALVGADGLYFYENSLLAIQNFESPHRVVRFYLNDAGDRVVKAEVLESNHPLYNMPTTGTLVGKDFYYIANSQLRSFDENGKIFPPEKLKNVTILKLKL